ncbi:ABC transporter permease [Desulfoplanes formicivorans]|uniref:Membrane protein n=1 Tax=Desulfoplanes formicivorans TaxID=1592317 RepID=A0A194AH12_9BACT|nr:ABC transporter permease [Desulfoplanes formicivorans]GAU08500.1 membrane protein [Desulfoplanes formicivorans]
MISISRLAAVARKEFLHVIRDWRSLVMAVAIPLLLILLFGYALSLDLKNVPTMVLDRSQTPQSREFISLFQGSPYFEITRFTNDYKEMEQGLDRGDILVGLVIPDDFARCLLAGKDTSIQVLVDGSDANSARLAMNYVSAIGASFSLQVKAMRMQGRHISGNSALVDLRPRTLYNQDLRSQNGIIPGIVAIVMVVIASMLTSVTIAREWETGTMEQLLATPIRVPELLLGKVIPYFVIGMVDVALSVGLGYVLFDVPLRGSTGLVFGLASIFLIGTLFYGLMISIVTKSQVLANQIALLSSFMPSIMLSGFMFAIADMPWLIQKLSYILPARYLIAILRGIYLKGIGLEILLVNAVLLAVYMVLMIVWAHAKMRLVLE